ncbi:sensor histidine kinase [Stenotrophomonas maltophilia]|uniref:sensor histidine kinase n=1 Tax=Stenotrophomonas maltophilia TaxID=40324 RepID=UPI000DB1825A|nr:sensor histidine kinase [Stenotrophomonas maltophilia]PZS64280.1 two-component sensor histidine kinase [Stenotrophomonas maltophilia]
MRLADFIERNARDILEDAVAFAETQAPEAVEFSAKQLRNHLPQILQAVVDDLRTPQTDSQQLAKSHGLAPLKPGPESAASYHGRTRAIAGFGLNQMVAEYRALRASVLRRWASDQQLVTSSIDDILRFNEAIDQAVAESLAQFSAEVESWRQIFLAALGHDLRGPLAAVMFSADTLASGLQDPALSRQAERILNGSMRMNKLLDDLLAYSRSKLGDGMAIHPVDCDLAQSLGEEVELLRAALPHVPIKYEVEGDARGCFDASSLREAVHNLTTNAAKYGEHGTDVRISLEGLVDQIMITVSNTGAELSDEAFNVCSIPCAEARTTRHKANERAWASACSWSGKSATRTAARSMDDGGMVALHSSSRSQRTLIEATGPATALQEPVHHEDIDQPQLTVPERLR